MHHLRGIGSNTIKPLLVTTLVAGALVGSDSATNYVNLTTFPQPGLIYYSTDDVTKTAFPVGNPASYGTFGNLNIAVYYAPAGTPSPFTPISAGTLGLAWTESDNVYHQIRPVPGNGSATFALSSISRNADAYESVMVLGWTGSYGDWNSAYAANTANPGSVLLGWTGSALSGGELAWDLSTTVPPETPASLAGGKYVELPSGVVHYLGYGGLVLQVIPEPSVFALAGLGAVALMNFRRRR